MKKSLTVNSYVCEDHFEDSDIIKWDETRLADGTVHRLERVINKLRDGAIPIAVNVKKSCSSEQQIDCDRTSVDLVHENVNSIEIENAQFKSIENPQSTATVNRQKLTFEVLLKSYRNFKLPNEQWAGIVDGGGNSVTFLTVKDEILRRIRINDDFSTQVLLDEIPVRIKHLSCPITSEEDIVRLINFVDSMNVCENFKDAKRLLNK